jgi:single-strand DNA-binding protein
VVLTGRMTADPELRQTNSGKSVVSFSIAVKKRTKPRDGESDSDFLRITAWGPSATYVHNYLGKGRLIACDGRLQTRKWQDQNGNNRETVEIVADNIHALDRSENIIAGRGADDVDPFAEGGKSYSFNDRSKGLHD